VAYPGLEKAVEGFTFLSICVFEKYKIKPLQHELNSPVAVYGACLEAISQSFCFDGKTPTTPLVLQ